MYSGDWHLIDELRDLLNMGMSSAEVEQHLGVKHPTIVKMVKGRHPVEHQRIIHMRRSELDARRPFIYTEATRHRLRCVHGAWTADGSCQHGKIQGRKDKAA